MSRTDESWVKRFLAGFAIVLLVQTGVLIYWVGRAETRIARNERDIERIMVLPAEKIDRVRGG